MLGGQAAVNNARRYTRNRDDMCLLEVQTWMQAPWSGPYAEDAWRRWGGQHPGDKNPPPGVPVYWHSPRHRYGHIALSVGGGRVRSTDYPRNTYVGEATIDEISRWGGYTYLGWSDRFSGGPIPDIGAPAPRPPTPSGWASGTVFVNVCRENGHTHCTNGCDSIRNVQKRLIDLGFAIPAGVTGKWPVGGQTTAALRAWQQRNGQGGEWATGRKLGSQQARKLFAGTGLTVDG
jgi:hypothetical protein